MFVKSKHYENNFLLAKTAVNQADENACFTLSVQVRENEHTDTGTLYFTRDPSDDPSDFDSWLVFIGVTNSTGNYTLRDCVDELELY